MSKSEKPTSDTPSLRLPEDPAPEVLAELDAAGERPLLLDLVTVYARGPVVEAPSIGHSPTSEAVTLG